MSILTTELIWYLSGGTSNTDPNASLGGIISTTQIQNNVVQNLFANVGVSEDVLGSTKYRGIYIKNTNSSLTLQSSALWIQSQPSDGSTTITIGLDPAGLNATETTIANENTAPAGVTFSAPANFAGGLSTGNVPNGQYYGFWVKRITPVSAPAFSSSTFQLEIQGGTN